MIKFTQRVFEGLIVNIDKIDMRNEATLDCCNINISTIGKLQSMSGMVKDNTSELESGATVDVLHQLDSDVYAVCNGKVLKL